jgi:thioester reductase-like protein
MRRGDVFLTGSTGFLGMSVLARIVERGDRHVWALVRASDQEEADERLRGVLERIVDDPQAAEHLVTAVPGDLTRRGLGMPASGAEAIAARVTHVVHSAASVEFTLPLDEARAINVEGTRRVLEFAHRCASSGGVERVAHVSTAYVAGRHAGVFREGDLDVGQDFNNTYEQTKNEAEQLVRGHAERLPIQVLRPSIVVGEDDAGWTASFNVIYAPLRMFAKGALKAIPVKRGAPVDVVSVSYVADSIVTLALSPDKPSGTFHLTAGDSTSTVGELIDMSASRIGQKTPLAVPPPLHEKVVHPLMVATARGRQKKRLRNQAVFYPYFTCRVRFDTSRAREELEPHGIRPRDLSGYFDRLIDYAEASEWGRAPIARPESRRVRRERAIRHEPRLDSRHAAAAR